MTSNNFNFLFTLKEKQILFSLLGYAHNRIEKREELSSDIFFLGDSKENLKQNLLEIAKKVWLIEIVDNKNISKQEFLKFFKSISNEDIEKMLRGR